MSSWTKFSVNLGLSSCFSSETQPAGFHFCEWSYGGPFPTSGGWILLTLPFVILLKYLHDLPVPTEINPHFPPCHHLLKRIPDCSSPKPSTKITSVFSLSSHIFHIYITILLFILQKFLICLSLYFNMIPFQVPYLSWGLDQLMLAFSWTSKLCHLLLFSLLFYSKMLTSVGTAVGYFTSQWFLEYLKQFRHSVASQNCFDLWKIL